MGRKLVYVGFAYKHHKGTHAGYHHIKDYIDYDYYIECQKEFEFLFFDVKTASLFKRVIRRLYAITLGEGCPMAMFRALCYSWMHKENVCFHIIYGDNIYSKFFYKLKRKNHKVVVTVHQPFDNYMKNKKVMNKLKWPDNLILLSDSEISRFVRFTGKNNVVYIPHGICDDFYQPSVDKRDVGKSVLMVGNWLRDFDLAEKVFMKLKDEYPEISIDMVGNKVNKQRFCNLVHYHCGISDNELLSLYQNCTVMFLPLLRFTANNALLEAASTACRILIATDNVDDNSYFPIDYIRITNRDVDHIVKTLIEYMSNSVQNEELRQYVSINYSWRVISGKVRQHLLSDENPSN